MEKEGAGARKASKRLRMLKVAGFRGSSSVSQGIAGSPRKGEATEDGPAADRISAIREEQVGLRLLQNPPATTTARSPCIPPALRHP